ncbi:hypothetical protein [Luteipulveratus mongoliensis]|nr:hypothetical protein [Luteipulveratus mongoliensis]
MLLDLLPGTAIGRREGDALPATMTQQRKDLYNFLPAVMFARPTFCKISQECRFFTETTHL